MWKVVENTWVHLIHEKQFCNQFCNSSKRITGNFLFISFISNALWLTFCVVTTSSRTIGLYDRSGSTKYCYKTVLGMHYSCLQRDRLGDYFVRDARAVASPCKRQRWDATYRLTFYYVRMPIFTYLFIYLFIIIMKFVLFSRFSFSQTPERIFPAIQVCFK